MPPSGSVQATQTERIMGRLGLVFCNAPFPVAFTSRWVATACRPLSGSEG